MDNQLTKAISLLQQGKIVAFPTETVYGLGADATNEAAIRKVFTIKNRPLNHPLIVHISDISKVGLWAKDVPDEAMKLANFFWPGPMTLILPKGPDVNDIITAGGDTVALRIPRHPTALEILRHLDGLVAPSANAHCHISPTTKEHVESSLGANSVDMIVDGGKCEVGIESTIIFCTKGSEIKILRQGIITPAEIESVTGKKVSIDRNSKVKAPGQKSIHYAPRTKTFSFSGKSLSKLITNNKNQHIVVIARGAAPAELPNSWSWIEMPSDIRGYSTKLYAALHEADMKNPSTILIEEAPQLDRWGPISERINKCSTPVVDQHI